MGYPLGVCPGLSHSKKRAYLLNYKGNLTRGEKLMNGQRQNSLTLTTRLSQVANDPIRQSLHGWLIGNKGWIMNRTAYSVFRQKVFQGVSTVCLYNECMKCIKVGIRMRWKIDFKISKRFAV